MNELKTDDVSAISSRVSPEQLARLLALVDEGTISDSIAKDVLEKMFDRAGRPMTSSRRRV